MSSDAIMAFLHKALEDPNLQDRLEALAQLPAGPPAVAAAIKIAADAGFSFTAEELTAALALRNAEVGSALTEDQLDLVGGGSDLQELSSETMDAMQASLSREQQMTTLLGQFSRTQENVYARIAGGAKA